MMNILKANDSQECIKILKKQKYRQIGYGAFSRVFAKSKKSRYVYKVNCEHDNSLLYLNWVKRSKNKYGPKIVYIKKFKDGTYVVKMERLYKCTQKEYRMVCEASYSEIYSDWWGYTYYNKEQIENRFPGIFTFFKSYNKKFKSIDMHSGNIGKRRNNQLVIFDPYVED